VCPVCGDFCVVTQGIGLYEQSEREAVTEIECDSECRSRFVTTNKRGSIHDWEWERVEDIAELFKASSKAQEECGEFHKAVNGFVKNMGVAFQEDPVTEIGGMWKIKQEYAHWILEKGYNNVIEVLRFHDGIINYCSEQYVGFIAAMTSSWLHTVYYQLPEEDVKIYESLSEKKDKPKHSYILVEKEGDDVTIYSNIDDKNIEIVYRDMYFLRECDARADNNCLNLCTRCVVDENLPYDDYNHVTKQTDEEMRKLVFKFS